MDLAVCDERVELLQCDALSIDRGRVADSFNQATQKFERATRGLDILYRRRCERRYLCVDDILCEWVGRGRDRVLVAFGIITLVTGARFCADATDDEFKARIFAYS